MSEIEFLGLLQEQQERITKLSGVVGQLIDSMKLLSGIVEELAIRQVVAGVDKDLEEL